MMMMTRTTMVRSNLIRSFDQRTVSELDQRRKTPWRVFTARIIIITPAIHVKADDDDDDDDELESVLCHKPRWLQLAVKAETMSQ